MHLVGKDSIIVGVDVHKYSHQAVAMSCFGDELGKLTFTNEQLPGYVSWLQSLGKKEDIIIGVEDVNGLGVHLVSQLQNAGFHTRYVPAIYTERARRHSSSRDKNDYLDAKRVGKVILTRSEETLRMLDLLLQERDALVHQQTGLKNQIHTLLHQYYGDGYQRDFSDIFSETAREWYSKDVQRKEPGSTKRWYISGSIVRRYQLLKVIGIQAAQTQKLIEEQGKKIPLIEQLDKSIKGCGLLTACKVFVEVGTITRFSTEAKLAKYAGIAPQQNQSGKNNRYYTNPFGNRKLNTAVHTIALSQVRSSTGKKYFEKKIKEGKTKLWAIRCLKRFIIRRIFKLLKPKISITNTNSF